MQEDMLKHHALWTLAALVVFILGALAGPLGILGLYFSGLVSLILVLAIPVVGLKSTESIPKRLAFVGLEIANIVILGACLSPLMITC